MSCFSGKSMEDENIHSTLSSPENIRGTTVDEGCIFVPQLNISEVITPDIKNSTFKTTKTGSGTGLPELEYSPIEATVCSSGFPLLNSFSEGEAFNASTSFESTPEANEIECRDVGSHILVTEEDKGVTESQPVSAYAETSSLRRTCQMVANTRSVTSSLNTPTMYAQRRAFDQVHHSCLTHPPKQWIATPLPVPRRKHLTSSQYGKVTRQQTETGTHLEGAKGPTPITHVQTPRYALTQILERAGVHAGTACGDAATLQPNAAHTTCPKTKGAHEVGVQTCHTYTSRDAVTQTEQPVDETSVTLSTVSSLSNTCEFSHELNDWINKGAYD